MEKLKVFISYASEDRADALKLYTSLKQAGLEPWLDKVNLMPGQNWEFEILNAMQLSNLVCILFSKRSIDKRGYVQKEFKLALDILDEIPDGDIFIIPVRLEDCKIPQRFYKLHYCDLFEADGMETLVKTLNPSIRNNTKVQFSRTPISEANTMLFPSKNLKLTKGGASLSLSIVIFYTGFALYTISLCFPAREAHETEFYQVWTFDIPIRSYVSINFSHLSILSLIILMLSNIYNKYLLLIPFLGLLSGFYLLTFNHLKPAYFANLLGQLIITAYFAIQVISFTKKIKVAC